METTNNKLPLHKVGRKSNAFFKARKKEKYKIGDEVFIEYIEIVKGRVLHTKDCAGFYSISVQMYSDNIVLKRHEWQIAKSPYKLVKKICKRYDKWKGNNIQRLIEWEQAQKELENDALEQEYNARKEAGNG